MVSRAGPPPEINSRELRATIEDFIQNTRLAPKLEDLDKKLAKETDPEKTSELAAKRKDLLAKHQREAWLADAAHRVSQIQLVSHAIKYTNPDARGSNIHFPPGLVSQDNLLGSHSQIARQDDVVGNAAALDVYAFLRLEHQGRAILDYILARSQAVEPAFSDDPEQAAEWREAFAGITQGKGKAASHTLAKQVYFPLAEGGYHLLAPLFPTGLVQTVYERLQNDRFSEEAKAARQARKDGKPWEQGYPEYPDLAIQAYGGTKPQNISQLNSQRHGENWLLPSLPPSWESQGVKPPLRVKNLFGPWLGRRPEIRSLTRYLACYLYSTKHNNLEIREHRAEVVKLVIEYVLLVAAEVQQLPPGWSLDGLCRLNQAQILWLDPGRGLTEPEFADEHKFGDWPEEIAHQFGVWFNGQLRYYRKRLPLGDPELLEWEREIKKALPRFREELAYDQT